MYKPLIQLKNQLENYVYNEHFDEHLSFGYFFNQYVRRQDKLDKEFAADIGVTQAAVSQYINNRRKPTREFLIRLELHSAGLFPALTLLKLLQKEREYDILNDTAVRIREEIHIRKRIDLNGH